MARLFTDLLRAQAAEIWEAQFQHPFVCGIATGTLGLERFKFWVRQDYVFLVEYARLLALAVSRSPDLETMTRFARLLSETLETEMSLHRGYAAEFGIRTQELECEIPAPTTRAYANFLVRTAATGDYAELLAALLPCMWGFSELGQRLAKSPPPADECYAKFIAMYSSAEFAELARWSRELLDCLSAGLPDRELKKLTEAFLTSSRYEWQFWEMAWRMERWPV